MRAGLLNCARNSSPEKLGGRRQCLSLCGWDGSCFERHMATGAGMLAGRGPQPREGRALGWSHRDTRACPWWLWGFPHCSFLWNVPSLVSPTQASSCSSPLGDTRQASPPSKTCAWPWCHRVQVRRFIYQGCCASYRNVYTQQRRVLEQPVNAVFLSRW